MNKLYVSDLDGTLLRNDATLSDYSREILIDLINNNVNFTIASARSFSTIKKILEGLPLKLPVIEFNGAYITDFHTGEHIVVNEINPKLTSEILNLIIKHDNMPFISSFDGEKDNLYYEDIINGGMQYYLDDRIKAKDTRLRKINKLSHVLNEKIVCFTIMNRKEKLTDLECIIKEKYDNEVEVHIMENQYSPGWYWLTIHDKKATKDVAILTLCEKLGLNKSNLTVFGDNVNDIKMFKSASKAVAVSNAKEELKKYSTDIIGSNEEDSVVKYILKDVLQLSTAD